MTTATATIPANYDPLFIKAQAGVTDFGYDPEAGENGRGLIFNYSDFAAVEAAIAAYPVAHLEVERPVKLAQASFQRDQRILAFSFGGMDIVLDAQCRSDLTGAALGLSRNPSVEALSWSLGGGVFVEIPSATMLALADAAFLHVQACFNAHKVIAAEINAAADINELAAIDIANHPAWPA